MSKESNVLKLQYSTPSVLLPPIPEAAEVPEELLEDSSFALGLYIKHLLTRIDALESKVSGISFLMSSTNQAQNRFTHDENTIYASNDDAVGGQVAFTVEALPEERAE